MPHAKQAQCRNDVSLTCNDVSVKRVPAQSLPGTRFTRRRFRMPRPRARKLEWTLRGTRRGPAANRFERRASASR